MPGYTEMNNAVKYLVTISAQSRASKTHGEEQSERKAVQSSEAMEKYQGRMQTKSNQGAVMVEGVRQLSVPTRDNPQHETCAYQVSETSRRIGNKTRRAKNRNKEKTNKK